MTSVPAARRSLASSSLGFVPALLYAGLIFYLSSYPIPPSLAPPQGADKLVHFVEYGALGFFLAFAFARLGMRPARVVLWSFVLGTLYGISDELHQSFVPARSAEVLDAVADAIGSFMGALGYVVLSHLWRRRRA